MSEPTQTNRKKSRRRNGDGNTYRHKNGWRTVISHKGHTVTAMGRSEQESRRLAKEKIKKLPIYDGSLVPEASKLTTGDFLTNWITKKHKTSIAATTYRRYASLINVHIIPALGNIKLQAVTKNHVNALMLQMRELVTKKLYVGLVSSSEIFRTEIEWAPELIVIEDVRRLIKLELPLEWQGTLIVDDKPILSADSQDCMLWADVKRSKNGGVDLNVRQLFWRGGTPDSNRPLG